jgi:hypothetical protein
MKGDTIQLEASQSWPLQKFLVGGAGKEVNQNFKAIRRA